MVGGKNTTIWEWVIVFGTLAAAIVLSTVADLAPKWEHALVYTVIVFTTVCIALRPAWRRPAFWRGLATIFSIHTLAIYRLTLALPAESRGIRGVPLIAACMAECLLIGSVLWRISSRRPSQFEKTDGI